MRYRPGSTVGDLIELYTFMEERKKDTSEKKAKARASEVIFSGVSKLELFLLMCFISPWVGAAVAKINAIALLSIPGIK